MHELGLFRGTHEAKHRDRVPVAITKAECGDLEEGGLPCPFRGCRGPEVAAGALFLQLEAAFQASLASLMLKWRPLLSAEQWAALLLEYGKGKSHIVYIITVKTSYWQELPWLLCALGHPDEEVARDKSRTIVQKFSACPDAAVNHRVTMRVCHPNLGLGVELRAFLGGAARAELPEFYKFCAGMAGVPITERMDSPQGLKWKGRAFCSEQLSKLREPC